ncbi:hypothetical protein GCM10007913_33600 [Devosia yakushimensis]|uniref:DUF218 domain-containing protein n=1 Tax=Devosia yakushimensis TaxID=470028 RepID=A0ABQ5UII9_9HYPH|nr:hypothetical protein GCM10007913_33600 [Devosia yakushimensis]
MLANLMDRYGRLNDDSSARLETAVGILKETPKSRLITSGWNYRPDSSIMIAHAMRDCARNVHGIAPHRILTDSSARDTVGDALFVKRNVVEPSHIRDLTVVSSAYHLPRVQQIFEFVFGSGYRMRFVSTQIDHTRGVEKSEIASLAAFRSTFDGVLPGDTEAIFQRLVRKHPLYNGTVHPAF